MLPWLQPSQQNKHKPPFHCEGSANEGHCGADQTTRQGWHCGYLPREEWTGEKPNFDRPFIGRPEAKEHQVDISKLPVCPGWVVRQPAVLSAAQACAALEKGELATYYPNAASVLLEAALLMLSSFNMYQSAILEKA